MTPYFVVSPDGIKHLVLHLLFLHNLTPFAHGSINGVYWTLGVEMQFYLLLIVLSRFVKDRGGRFIVMVCLFFLISAIWRFIGFSYHESTNRFYFSTQLLGSLDRFAVGLIIARVVTGDSIWVKNIMTLTIVRVLAVLIPVIVAYSLSVMDKYSGWESLPGFVLFGWWLSIMFGILTFGIISFLGNRIAQIINRASGLAYLGKISYIFYLYHIPVILAMKPVLSSYVGNFFSQLALVFGCVLAISMASYHLVEAKWHAVR